MAHVVNLQTGGHTSDAMFPDLARRGYDPNSIAFPPGRRHMIQNGDSGAQADEQGLVITDMSLRIAAIDKGAASILNEIAGVSGPQMPMMLPDAIIRELRGSPADLHGRAAFFHGIRGRYTCRVAVLKGRTGDAIMLALSFQRETDIREQIEGFAAEYELTARERQTLIGIANGQTCKEIAQNLNISPNTVKHFQRLMMVKIGVARRGEIISKVLDHRRHKS